MKKYILIIGILAIVAGVGFGLMKYFKPTKDFAKSEADFSVTAQQLFTEFSKDEKNSSAKYVHNDKTVEISGVIQSISANSDSTKTIILSVGNPDGDVCCTLTQEASVEGKLSAGKSIKLKGQCTGLQELIAKEVILIRCAIVQ